MPTDKTPIPKTAPPACVLSLTEGTARGANVDAVIQTFPHVLKAIENSVSLKERCYAIIADEAHSSQSGRTATQLKEVLTHYRLSKIKQQDLKLVKEGGQGLLGATDVGTGKARSKQEQWLSEIIARLNELFVTDGLTDQDLINYAYTIRDKVRENVRVMDQIANNSPEQAMLGDFAGALDDAVMSSSEVHQNQMTQYLNNPELQARFQRVIFDLLLAKGA